MALTLLLQAINKSSRNRIDVRDAGMLGMLGGLLPFLVRAMRSRHSTVASTALRIFSVLVPLPLPGGSHQACTAYAAMPFPDKVRISAETRDYHQVTIGVHTWWRWLHRILHGGAHSCHHGMVKQGLSRVMLGVGLPEQAPQAGAAMTALLRKAPDSNAPIAQECFKLLATLLRSCSSYQVHPLCYNLPIDGTSFKSLAYSMAKPWLVGQECTSTVVPPFFKPSLTQQVWK